MLVAAIAVAVAILATWSGAWGGKTLGSLRDDPEWKNLAPWAWRDEEISTQVVGSPPPSADVADSTEAMLLTSWPSGVGEVCGVLLRSAGSGPRSSARLLRSAAHPRGRR